MASNSTEKRNSRYVQGGLTDRYPDRLGWWERTIYTPQDNDIVIEITNEYQHRPDKVAYTYYGSRDLDWLVLQYNTIVDVVTEFVVGRTIRLPSQSRVQSEILINQPGGNIV